MQKIYISEITQSKPNNDDIFFFGEREANRTKKILSQIKENESKQFVFLDRNIQENIENILHNLQNKNTIFIDSSCLPRKTLAKIFAIIATLVSSKAIEVHLIIGYSLSKFKEPKIESIPFNKSFSPVHPYFAGWTVQPEAPVEVIVSLGYEESKATGAVEYLEPKTKWVFIPNSPEHEFLNEVKKKNEILLLDSQDHQINYQVLDPVDIYYKLDSLTSSITPQSKLVILPFGPKIFFSISLLIALHYPQISIWHVDAEGDDYGMTLEASEHSILFSCTISPE